MLTLPKLSFVTLAICLRKNDGDILAIISENDVILFNYTFFTITELNNLKRLQKRKRK